MRYRMEELTREQVAAEDPFGGHGTFLPFPGLGEPEISGELTEMGLGHAHSFIWEGIGAWAEVPGAGRS